MTLTLTVCTFFKNLDMNDVWPDAFENSVCGRWPKSLCATVVNVACKTFSSVRVDG